MNPSESGYRGRLAPSPTGYLHLGHARTFWTAQTRARAAGGKLILRNEDLDRDRCRPEFVRAMLEDLRWFGLAWAEGPDCGGPDAPYQQSERLGFYRAALEKLRAGNFLYPCTCSRKDIQAAARAPHAADDEEPVYPGTCRPKYSEGGEGLRAPSDGRWGAADFPVCCIAGFQTRRPFVDRTRLTSDQPADWSRSARGGILSPDANPVQNRGVGRRAASLRFRVPEGEGVAFVDGNLGAQTFVAGRDFGDFIVWRHDGVPAYQLACVVDDAAMRITEVVRGADLLVSTARQLLLYRALGLTPPAFFHCELLCDASGRRLAKRHDALSLRHFRQQGVDPAALRRPAP